MKLVDLLVEELPKRGGWPDGVDVICQYETGDLNSLDGAAGWEFIPIKLDVIIEKHRCFGCDGSETEKVTRSQYEAALAAKNVGWITWDGGACPVYKGYECDMKLRGGDITTTCNADLFRWYKLGSPDDIIAYRIYKPDSASDEADLNECIGQTVAWDGCGLPPAGTECEIKRVSDWFTGKVLYLSDQYTVIGLDNGEQVFETVALQFRPLRTEAERKRDISIRAIYEILDAGVSTEQDAKDIYDAIASGKIPGVKLED